MVVAKTRLFGVELADGSPGDALPRGAAIGDVG